MNNKEFAKKALNIADNYNTSYVWGAFGLVANASNMQRMINQYSKNNKYLERARQIYGNGYFFDCVGLIKGILWGWCGNASATYGGAKYASNGVPDVSADQMITYCSGVSTNFSNIEVGEAVWLTGHIGIYIGNGIVIEATPAWNGGVQKSALANIGSISGLNSRKWTKHGKLPYITYANTEDTIAFPDIAGHYAENHIDKLCAYGILSGYEDGTFKPNNSVTRAEFATMAANALEKACGYALDMVSAFTDISGHWAEKAITKMVACGIVNGFEDNTFKPDQAITRGQASIIASNMLSYCGIQRRDSDGFPDTMGHYAEHHIKSLKAFGVVNGYEDGLFRPDEEITRGQAAMYIANCLTVLGK